MRNKFVGRNIIDGLKKGKFTPEDYTPEIIWTVKKVAATEIETEKIASLEKLTTTKLKTNRGQFVIEYMQKTAKGELLLCVFGSMDDTVATPYGNVNHKNVNLHLFLLRYVPETSNFELKGEISTDLPDKHFKQTFADVLFDFLKKGATTGAASAAS